MNLLTSVYHLSFVIILLLHQVNVNLSLPRRHDQRQNGDLNVMVDVKNVKIIALTNSDLLDDYTEYDYFYDYADLTVKPPAGKPTKPTSKPSTTLKPTTIVATTEQINDANSTVLNSTTATIQEQYYNDNVTAISVSSDQEETTKFSSFNSSSSISELDVTTAAGTTSSGDSNFHDINGSKIREDTKKTRINDKMGDPFESEDVVLATAVPSNDRIQSSSSSIECNKTGIRTSSSSTKEARIFLPPATIRR